MTSDRTRTAWLNCSAVSISLRPRWRGTHGNVQQELLVGIAEKIATALVPLFGADDAGQCVARRLVQAVGLLQIEEFKQRDLGQCQPRRRPGAPEPHIRVL